MKDSFLLLLLSSTRLLRLLPPLLGAGCLLSGCVNTTRICHEDGTWTVVTRNPALLDAGVVITAHYAPGDPTPMMIGPPNVAAAPSIIAQLAGPVATVWSSYRLEKGLRDSGDEVEVQGSSTTIENSTSAAAAAEVDVDIDLHGSKQGKK